MPEIAEKSRPLPTRRQQASEARRQRILAGARLCFGRDGFAGATVGAIAKEAGVSNGLLYQFFESKDRLLQVVLEDVVRDWVRALVPREVEGATAAETLEGMFRRSVEFCRSHPLLPALLRGESGLKLERVSSAGADRVQPHRDLVAAILRRGIAAGEFRADLDVPSVADLICQLQSDYSSRAYRRDPQFPDSPEIIDAAVRFVRDALRP